MTYLDEVDARDKAATKGPWKKGEYVLAMVFAENGYGVALVDEFGNNSVRWQQDLDFIAHAREDVPRLRKMVRMLTELLKEGFNKYPKDYRKWVEDVKDLLVKLEK